MLSLFIQNDHEQNLRIKRFLIAFGAYLIWSVICFIGYAMGLTTVSLKILSMGVFASILVNVLLYLAFRTGLNKKAKDPSLTLLQMVIATFWIMVVMYYAYEARSVCLLVYMVVLVFGFFRLRVGQFLILSLYALVNYSAVVFLVYKLHPEAINAKIDVLNIIVLALILPWFAMMGGYISNLRKNIAKALSTIERLTNNIQDVIFVTDMNLNYTYVSPSVKILRGYEPEETMRQSLSDAFAPSSMRLAMDTIAEVLESAKSENRDFKSRTIQTEIRRKDESSVWTETKISVVLDKKGQASGLLGVMRDITERKQMEEQIHHLATHDALTGLPNRLMFGQLLNHAIETAKRYQRNFAVFFVDLDRFKIINDTLGHEAGDQLLKEVSQRFEKALRAVDIVARLGGDEFVILMEEIQNRDQVVALAKKILAVALEPVFIKGEECRVTASIGISLYPDDGEDEQTLMKNADIAMYFAKEQGKNDFQFYSRKIKTQPNGRLAIERNLRAALDKNEFSLDYQARLNVRTGAIAAVEALLRWTSASLGVVTPTQFIPVAEETGLIVPIGRWVLKTACAQNVAWQKQGLPPVCISVNLSFRQLMDDQFAEDVQAVLKTTGLEPSFLELEITESMLMHNPSRMIPLLSKLKEIGVRLAIDNFGTGYSSLAHIRQFPVDTIKVDRSFIRNIAQESEDKAIIESIIKVGKLLSLTIVAEGVETEVQDEFLRKHVCDEMQGFYFSKPVDPDQFTELLRRYNKPS